MARGRKDGVTLTGEERREIEQRLGDFGWTKQRLIEETERSRSTIFGIFKTGKTSRGTVEILARVLKIDFPRLLPQLQFEFEITREFLADAQRALEAEAGPVVLRGTLRPAPRRLPGRRDLRVTKVGPHTDVS